MDNRVIRMLMRASAIGSLGLYQQAKALEVSPQPSKVRDHAPEFDGKVKLMPHSSLRKLARAMNRDMVPGERQRVINEALASARKRAHVFLNGEHKRRGSKN